MYFEMSSFKRSSCNIFKVPAKTSAIFGIKKKQHLRFLCFSHCQITKAQASLRTEFTYSSEPSVLKIWMYMEIILLAPLDTCTWSFKDVESIFPMELEMSSSQLVL